MNFSKIKVGIIIVALLMITTVLYAIYRNWPECTVVDGFDASVRVKAIESGKSLLGFNTDKDALKFGAVSPGAWVKRSANAQYKHEADVTVFMTGDLMPWVRIEPNNFSIMPNQAKPVSFELNVPLDAADGNYTGRVVFCFKRK